VPVDAWIAPRAADLAPRLRQVEAVRRVAGDEIEARLATDGRRWPILFFAMWSLIHLEGAQPNEALAALLTT